jgi:hypothetical protein
MTGIDTFPGDLKKRFVSNLKMSGGARKVKIITGRSQDKLKDLPPGSFDIIYIDGSHVAADVLTDAVLSWPLLKKGGFLIFDDYLMSTMKSGPDRLPDKVAQRKKTEAPFLPLELNPKAAIDAFMTVYRNNLEVIYSGYQVILKKRKGDPDWLLLGEYVYSWREKTLYNAKTKEVVPLFNDEQKVVERLFITRPFGTADFCPDDELLKDRDYAELKKRLRLDFLKDPL